MGVLRLVGEKTEKPDIVSKLLDITYFKERPGYHLASANNLVLFDCKYKDLKFEIPTGANHKFLQVLMYSLYHDQMLKLRLIGSIAQNFKNSILGDKQFKIKKVITKKTKRKKTIEESYKNHLYGKSNLMVTPEKMREIIREKVKRLNKKKKEWEEKKLSKKN